MAQTTLKYIINIVAGILQDESETESERLWSEQELVDYSNIVQTNIVRLKPEANPIIKTVKLASGIKHFIPPDGMALIRVIMNMGTDGNTPGDAVFQSVLSIIESFNPSWAQTTAVSAISNFIPDLKDPTLWYSNPSSDGTGYVMLQYSGIPTKIVWEEGGDWESAHIGIRDGYERALIEGILELAYSKDSDIPGNAARGAGHKSNFLQELSV